MSPGLFDISVNRLKKQLSIRMDTSMVGYSFIVANYWAVWTEKGKAMYRYGLVLLQMWLSMRTERLIYRALGWR